MMRATSFSSTKLPTPLYTMAASTATACTPSCAGLPKNRPSCTPLIALSAKTPVSNAPTVPPTPCAATTLERIVERRTRSPDRSEVARDGSQISENDRSDRADEACCQRDGHEPHDNGRG